MVTLLPSRVRQRFVEEGIESALNRREQKNRRRRIIDGEKEAYLIAIAGKSNSNGKEQLDSEDACRQNGRTELCRTSIYRAPRKIQTTLSGSASEAIFWKS